VTLSVTSSSGALVFTIEDTGIGIEAEAVGRLFNPFEQADGSTTRRYGGTGLGLSISRDLVSLMGGQITLTSIPNQGSRFTLALPLAGAEPPAPWPEREIAVLGLPEEDVSVLEQVAPRVRRLPAPLCPETVALLVIDHHALAEPTVVDLAGERLRRGKTVAVVVEPGGREALPPDCAQAIPIERPFRPRHLKMLLNATPDQPATAKPSRRLAGVRILGAEDNDVNRLVLEDMVSLEGGSLSCFENGRYAFEHLQQSGRASFDLVLTDIQMPEMDGYALARAIHDWAPDLPVIALTAHAMGEERDRCLAAGMVDHVVKPIRLETLVATVLRHHTPWPETTDLDPNRLLAHYAGRHDFVQRLVTIFLATHRTTPADLHSATGKDEIERIAALAHMVRSAAGPLLATQITELATQVEQAARAGAGETGPLARTLAEALTRLISELERTVAPFGVPGAAAPEEREHGNDADSGGR